VLIENFMELDTIMSLISSNPDMDNTVIDSYNKSSFKIAQENHFVSDVVVLWFVFESGWGKLGLTTGDHFIVTDGNGLGLDGGGGKGWNGVVDLGLTEKYL
jgi:hypothetical protein